MTKLKKILDDSDSPLTRLRLDKNDSGTSLVAPHLLNLHWYPLTSSNKSLVQN